MYKQDGNDETLVLLTLAGDQSAYEALVIRYEKAVIAAAQSVLRNQSLAEDAAQDAFITAWMKLNMLREPSKYGSWVCRIAKNCAKAMIPHFRSWLELEGVDYGLSGEEWDLNPEGLYVSMEEKQRLHDTVGELPERVKEVIRLHYFEGLSIAEIADRMRISEGTVKWQLHDGRKRLRKELCAMDEKENDTLVQRVMKKVEELKLWQLKNEKSGFAEVYKDVLAEVETLPESEKKYHALADVLMRGWWWLPGENKDKLFNRIREAALRGKNDDVMEFIVSREDNKVYGGARLEFIRDKQIPYLEQSGLVRTLAREWFWLGYLYFRNGQTEEGYAAFDKTQSLLTPSDRYYALTVYARRVEKKLEEGYHAKDKRRFLIGATADELRRIDGSLRHWRQEQYGEGYMDSMDRDIANLLHNVSRCDGWLFDDGMKVGETRVGSDGTTLTFSSDNEIVKTPCGDFENCKLWITDVYAPYVGHCLNKVWYREGVGIVMYKRTVDGLTDVRLLKRYHIVGGEGLLPLAAGNTWEYADTYDHDILISEMNMTVTHADEKTVMVATGDYAERFHYDENSWLDMIQQIRSEYWDEEGDHEKICDVSHAAKRAEELAKTPIEKAHTVAAVSAIRRIMETDPVFNPEHTAEGHWNFFEKLCLVNKDGRLTTMRNSRWCFEWKGGGVLRRTGAPLLYNDIYGILQDAAKCLWSKEWQIGASPIVEYHNYGEVIRTSITCEDGGTVVTRAGTFENCFKLCLNIEGMTDGLSYRGGKKVYWFAWGIGIVRTENYQYEQEAGAAVYELTSYEGKGEGYMPVADGLIRRYDAIGLTDGFVGGVAYSYASNGMGDIVIFKDAIGICKVLPDITDYGTVCGEVLEHSLFNEGKWQEGHLRHAINNFKIMQHYIFRNAHHFNNSNRSVELCDFNQRLMESFGGGEVPSAWYGIYAWTTLVKAAALFGGDRKEEGYDTLERAFAFYIKWNSLQTGDLLACGNGEAFGGIRIVKGKGVIQLPDGTREVIEYAKEVGYKGLWTALNSPTVWAWFNPVRNEDRFKAYIERAGALVEAEKR